MGSSIISLSNSSGLFCDAGSKTLKGFWVTATNGCESSITKRLTFFSMRIFPLSFSITALSGKLKIVSGNAHLSSGTKKSESTSLITLSKIGLALDKIFNFDLPISRGSRPLILIFKNNSWSEFKTALDPSKETIPLLETIFTSRIVLGFAS